MVLNTVGNNIASLFEFYPKKKEIYITSGKDGRHASVSHHYGNLKYNGSPTAALDFGCGTNAVMGRDLAKWIQDNFGDLCVELIHSTPFSSDNGFYIKHGKRYNYSQATRLAHRNHVHLAMSQAQVQAAYNRLVKKYFGTPAPKPAPTPDKVYYKIQRGDTLTEIAVKFKTTVAKIVALNPTKIKDPDEINAGDTIRVK